MMRAPVPSDFSIASDHLVKAEDTTPHYYPFHTNHNIQNAANNPSP